MMLTGENPWSIHQSALWQSYEQSHLVVNLEDLGERNVGFCLRSISFKQVVLIHAVKCYDLASLALHPLWRNMCCCPQESIASAKLEPANLRSNGRNTNHYTTEVALNLQWFYQSGTFAKFLVFTLLPPRANFCWKDWTFCLQNSHICTMQWNDLMSSEFQTHMQGMPKKSWNLDLWHAEAELTLSQAETSQVSKFKIPSQNFSSW